MMMAKRIKAFAAALALAATLVLGGALPAQADQDYYDRAPSQETMATTLTYLRKSPTAERILARVLANSNVFVRESKGTSTDLFLLCETTSGEPCGIIVWDKTLAVSYESVGAIQSPALQFMHEAIHALHYFDDPAAYAKRVAIRNLRYDDEEERVTIAAERTIAQELGEYQRESHHGVITVVQDVTFHRAQ